MTCHFFTGLHRVGDEFLNVHFMLSREDLRSIGHENKGTYYFDLSEINADLYDPLTAAIASYGKELFYHLVFTCSALAEYASAPRMPKSVVDSIAVAVKSYFARIAREIVRLLENSAILKGVHLISIDIEITELLMICRAVEESRSLVAIEFTDIDIFDRGIELIAAELSKTKIKYATFKHCGLTDGCIPCMIKFAHDVRRRFGREGLIEIDLSDNEITPREFKRVVNALNTFDLESEEARLEEENEQLRIEIDRLKGIINEVAEKGALFIVGDGAADLVANMRQIDARITRLEKS